MASGAEIETEGQMSQRAVVWYLMMRVIDCWPHCLIAFDWWRVCVG